MFILRATRCNNVTGAYFGDFWLHILVIKTHDLSLMPALLLTCDLLCYAFCTPDVSRVFRSPLYLQLYFHCQSCITSSRANCEDSNCVTLCPALKSFLKAKMKASMIQFSFCKPANPISCRQWQHLMPFWTVGMSFRTTVSVRQAQWCDIKHLCVRGYSTDMLFSRESLPKWLFYYTVSLRWEDTENFSRILWHVFCFPMQRVSFLSNVTNFFGNHVLLNINVTQGFLTEVQILQGFLICILFLGCTVKLDTN